MQHNAGQIIPDGRGGAWLFEGEFGPPPFPTAFPPIALHYTGGQWTRVPLLATVKIVDAALVSDAEGWAIAWTNPGANPAASAIFHYQDGA